MTTSEQLLDWRDVWHRGLAPGLSAAALEALVAALRTDDVRLVQGSTTTPPPLMCLMDWPVEAACALGFCGWQGEGLVAVGQVEEFFARAVYEADERLAAHGPAACRGFLRWWDDTPRAEAFAALLSEVEAALEQRATEGRAA